MSSNGKPTKLTNLKVLEVSGVDVPANPGAKVLLTKVDKRPVTKENQTMDEKAVQKMVQEAVEKSTGDLSTKLAKAEALAGMNDAEKAHLATLKSDEAKKKFYEATPAERAAELEKAAKAKAAKAEGDEDGDEGADADPSMADGDGDEEAAKGKKSKGMKKALATIEKQAETIEKQGARLEALEKAAEQTKLEKRAQDELGDLPGTLATKAATLKAMDAMPEAERTEALKMLKGASKIAKSFTESFGKSTEVVEGSPEDQLNKMAADLMKADGKLTKAKAFTKAAKSPEGAALYAQMQKQ